MASCCAHVDLVSGRIGMNLLSISDVDPPKHKHVWIAVNWQCYQRVKPHPFAKLCYVSFRFGLYIYIYMYICIYICIIICIHIFKSESWYWSHISKANANRFFFFLAWTAISSRLPGFKDQGASREHSPMPVPVCFYDFFARHCKHYL